MEFVALRDEFDAVRLGVHLAFDIADMLVGSVVENALVVNWPAGIDRQDCCAHFFEVGAAPRLVAQ